MGSKLILLLGLLVGAFLTLMCVNDNKNALSFKYAKTPVESLSTPDPQPVAKTEAVAVPALEAIEEATSEASVSSVAAEKINPSLSYSLKETAIFKATLPTAAKGEALDQFLSTYCPAEHCTQEINFEENVNDATWQTDVLNIASFLHEHNATNGLVAIEDSQLTVEGELPNPQTQEALQQMLNAFDNTINVSNTTTVADVPQEITEEVMPKSTLVIENTQAEINELLKTNPIYFEYNSDIISDKSKAILDKIIETINTSDIKALRVEGHTDAAGDADYNKFLSQKRAEAVEKYLIKHGIKSLRLQSIGYGEEKPISENPRDMVNRRVEIHLEQGE